MMRVAFVTLLVAGCVGAPTETVAPQPLIGVDGSHDQADRNCNVVLRDLTRPNSGFGGYEAQGDSWVWQGTLEISQAAADEGLTPAALYRSGSDPTWYEVTPTLSDLAATPGFARYTIRLDHDLPGPGMSATAIANSHIEVVPFLRLDGGGRLFDHNRHPGDLDNYVMTYPDLAVWRDDAVCAPPSGPQSARLVFDADFTEHREGVLAPGGEMTVVYATSRLDHCRQIRNGYPAWDLTAHVRFEPAGELRSVSVRDGAATMPVPPDARRAVLWFEATSITGCHEWDSDFGANYTFDAATPPAWVGNLDTLLTRDTSGDHCGGSPASGGFSFDTWVRERAAITNLCFQVYQPGLTDHDDPDLWQKLDASLHWRGAGESTWHVVPVSLDGRVGNDARYALSWRTLDPFRPYHCPEVATTTTPDGQYVQATLEYYVVVNGYELRPEPGAAFSGTFTGYANDPYRTQYCN